MQSNKRARPLADAAQCPTDRPLSPETWAIQENRRSEEWSPWPAAARAWWARTGVPQAQVGAEQSSANERQLGRRGSYEATTRGTSPDDGARQLQRDAGTTLSSVARLGFATMCSHYRLHYGKPEASSPAGPRAP